MNIVKFLKTPILKNIWEWLLLKIIVKEKVYPPENCELVKRVAYLNHSFSSVVRNLDITKHKIGSGTVIDSTNDPTLKTTLKYSKNPSIITINGRCKGNDVFNFSKPRVTEIENEMLKLNRKSITEL